MQERNARYTVEDAGRGGSQRYGNKISPLLPESKLRLETDRIKGFKKIRHLGALQDSLEKHLNQVLYM